MERAPSRVGVEGEAKWLKFSLPEFQEEYRQLTPWKPESPCPCKSGKRYGACCSSFSGLPLVKSVSIAPPGNVTGYAHANCYMRSTRNCSEKISREHFISKSVMIQCTPEGMDKVRVSGIFWQKPGIEQDIPLDALASNILCERHNNSLSPLDDVAGKFFSAVRDAGGLGRQSDVRRDLLFLVNGNALERWGVKTALGLYHSTYARAGGKCIADSFHLDSQQSVDCLSGGVLPAPLGMYAMATEKVKEHDFGIAPITNKVSQRFIGVQIQMKFIHLMFVVDPVEAPAMLNNNAGQHRTNMIEVTTQKRKAQIWLTWVGASRLKQTFYINA